MKKILIEIKNGTFKRAIAEEQMEIILVDYDRQDIGESPVHIYESEVLEGKYESFREYYSYEYSDEAEVREELKRLKL